MFESITAAFGAKANNIFELFTDYRGVSFPSMVNDVLFVSFSFEMPSLFSSSSHMWTTQKLGEMKQWLRCSQWATYLELTALPSLDLLLAVAMQIAMELT